MQNALPAEFYASNRARLIEAAGSGLYVIAANGRMQASADIAYPFEQDRNFYYLTGVEEPGCLLVMDAGRGEEWLVLPEVHEVVALFDGAGAAQELSAVSGVAEVLSREEGLKRLEGRLKEIEQCFALQPPEAYVDVYGMYTNPARKEVWNYLQSRCNSLEDVRAHLAHLRMVKRPEELGAIREAARITSDAYGRLLDAWRRKQPESEWEIESVLTAGYLANGTRQAYGNIIAGGERALVLHYMANERPLKEGELVLIDSAAKYRQYCADVTRTYPVGELSGRQKEVIGAVRELQKNAVARVKPGVTLKELEKLFATELHIMLNEIGVRVDEDRARDLCPHGLSHHLGLDTHDAADYSVPLEPGMVITVEPGIYLPDEGIGVRIEDDIVVTDGEPENLTSDIPYCL